MRLLLIIFSVVLAISALTGQAESVLPFERFMTMVKTEHPVTYQANLLNNMADKNEQMARGGFDPKLEGNWSHKSFDGKNYYSLASGAVKLPTWYGIELKAGYDRNSGQYLNESDIIPTRGLWNAGISIGLGKGLILDERRATLQKAKVYRQSTVMEQVLMRNELLFNAADAYLNWQVATAYVDIAKEGLALAELRFNASKSSFENGDKPAIDTLESLISLQARQLDEQKATQALVNARLDIENYLWLQGDVPLELEETAVPEVLDTELLTESVEGSYLMLESILAKHPEVLLYDYKVDNLDIDRKLAYETLKPDIRVAYNPLVAVANDALFDEFNTSNYKLGATFAYPLMQRKQRGKLQLIKLKIQDAKYDQAVKRQQLKVKLESYINNIRQTRQQLTLLDQTVTNYQTMLRAENRRLGVGESSIFVVNSREVKYLDSRYKLIEARRKLIYNRLTYLLYLAEMDNVL